MLIGLKELRGTYKATPPITEQYICSCGPERPTYKTSSREVFGHECFLDSSEQASTSALEIHIVMRLYSLLSVMRYHKSVSKMIFETGSIQIIQTTNG